MLWTLTMTPPKSASGTAVAVAVVALVLAAVAPTLTALFSELFPLVIGLAIAVIAVRLVLSTPGAGEELG